MTNTFSRYVTMQLGTHFGRRKPRWNFFNQKALQFEHGSDKVLLKKVLLATCFQFLLLSPLLYWTLQNYTFFETYIPASTHLKEYIITEKKWILFLFALSFVSTFVWNFVIFKVLFNFNNQFHSTNEIAVLHGEADYPRRAS